MRRPIRVRLSLIYSAILIVVIAVMELAGYLSVRAAMHSIVDHELETRIAGIKDHLERHLDKLGWAQMGQALEVHPAFQPSFLVIRSSSGEAVFEGRAMTGASFRAGAAGDATTRDGRNAVRILSVSTPIRGQTYEIVAGTDLMMPSAILRRLWLAMLLSMPPLVFICAMAGYWMSGRALAPIQQIVSAARSIDSDRLGQRVTVPPTGDEVQLLAETFNHMLQRIETGFRQMRDFTANASHELRTPVAIIRASAEVALLRYPPSEELYRETLERILRESERNSVLLEGMLEIARADSGIDRSEVSQLGLNRSLEEACEQVRPLAAARGIGLRFCAGEDVATVLADTEQLQRLWLILLDNAIKYTPAGGVVTVSAAMDAEGRPVAEIADTGIGIAPHHHSHIFERFYRTDKARTRSTGGAGLGLAIAREIAIIHGAEIGVESAVGRGARFRVTFPGQLPEASRNTPIDVSQFVR